LSELRFLGLKDFHDYFLRSADKLRPKSGKTMVAMCGCRGKASFDEAVVMWERLRAKLLRTRFCLICPKGTPLEQRKGLVRQRSISADLIFWLLLDQAKSN
jgi:hypothetical protein